MDDDTELRQCLNWLRRIHLGHVITIRDFEFIDRIQEEINSACEKENEPPEIE